MHHQGVVAEILALLPLKSIHGSRRDDADSTPGGIARLDARQPLLCKCETRASGGHQVKDSGFVKGEKRLAVLGLQCTPQMRSAKNKKERQLRAGTGVEGTYTHKRRHTQGECVTKLTPMYSASDPAFDVRMLFDKCNDLIGSVTGLPYPCKHTWQT